MGGLYAEKTTATAHAVWSMLCAGGIALHSARDVLGAEYGSLHWEKWIQRLHG